VKEQQITNIDQKRIMLFTMGTLSSPAGMLFLEYLLIAGVIFILWIVDSLKKSTKEMHWVVLLVTAVILGVVTMVQYFLQLTSQLAIKVVCKCSFW